MCILCLSQSRYVCVCVYESFVCAILSRCVCMYSCVFSVRLFVKVCLPKCLWEFVCIFLPRSLSVCVYVHECFMCLCVKVCVRVCFCLFFSQGICVYVFISVLSLSVSRYVCVWVYELFVCLFVKVCVRMCSWVFYVWKGMYAHVFVCCFFFWVPCIGCLNMWQYLRGPQYLSTSSKQLCLGQWIIWWFPPGHFTFLYGHKKYNRGSGRKRTKNKGTIWAWVNSKCKKGCSVTLHSLCIRRLTLTCILRENSTKPRGMLTLFPWSSLTAPRPCLMPTGLFCCPVSTAPQRLPSPTLFSEFLFPTLWLAFPCPLPVVSRSRAQAFVWFRAKTNKKIVCLAHPLHSVTNTHGTHVPANNSTNNNVMFFFISYLKIIYYNNYPFLVTMP